MASLSFNPNDRGLRRVVRELNLRDHGVDDDAVVQLLAQVADTHGLTAARALAALQSCATRNEQVVLATRLLRAGMTASEKADLVALLHSSIAITPSARDFLESVVAGREPQPLHGRLEVTRHRERVIEGRAPDGTTVRLTPMSRWVGRPCDSFERETTAAADGGFSFYDASMRTGDVYRLSYRLPQPAAAPWQIEIVKARGARGARDTRAPRVDRDQIELDVVAPGRVQVGHADPDRMISEAGAELRFVNERTGESQRAIVDERGSFRPVTLAAQPRDTIAVRAFDGTCFSKGLAFVVGPGAGGGDYVDLPDPSPRDVHQGGRRRRFEGSLFAHDGRQHTVPLQGRLNDCFLACGLTLCGFYYPQRLRENIRQLPNGHYEVTLWTGRLGRVPVKVEVDGDLYVDAAGKPLYMGSSDGSLWPMIAEKAIATYYGSYQNIDNGGKALDVVRLLTGEPRYMMVELRGAREDEIFETIASAVEAGRAAAVGTYDPKDFDYAGTGLVGSHNYAIIGVDRARRELVIRNPWGHFEPAGNGPDDGIFRYPLGLLTRHFKTCSAISAARRD